MTRRQSSLASGILLTLPSFLFVFVFLVYPVINLVGLSFFQDSPLTSTIPHFVGVRNYYMMLVSDTMWQSLGVTLAFTALSVALELVIGLLIAVLVSKLIIEARTRWEKRFAKTANTVFILPFAAPAIAAAVAWKMLLHPQFSPINALLGKQIAWFTDFPLLGITVADAWKMTPFMLFLLLAAILSIDPAQFEAAKLDGASGWQEFFHLTLPSILPVLAIATAFRAVDAFTKVFDIVYGTTGGGPGTDTQVFPLLVWKVAFSFLHFGQASALAVIAIVISAILGWLLILVGRTR